MFGSDKTYISILINELSIKVAQVKSSGAVEKAARSFAADTSTDAQAKALRAALNGFNKNAPVACIIPLNAATAKTIDVPSSDPEEIKSIINLQANRHTPYSREEVLISHINLGAGASGNTKVLLVIVHRNVVKERVTAIEKVGLNVDCILFAGEGMARFYAKALNLKKDNNLTGLVDVSLNAVNYVILFRSHLGFVRHIPGGIKALMESPEANAKLVEEINKSVAALVNEDLDLPPQSYLVTTDNDVFKNNAPSLETALNVKFQSSPYTHFIKGSSAIKKKLDKELADDSFLDVISPVVGLAKNEVNLMPEEMILKKKVELQSKEAIMAGVLVVLLMMSLGGVFISKIYFKDTFLNKNLREQYAQERQEAQRLQNKMNKMSVIHDFLKERQLSLDVLHELFAVTPTTVYLNNISLEEDGTVTIDGVSDSMSQVFSYVKALDDSKMFDGAKSKSTSTKKERGKDVAAFEITFKIKDAAKAKDAVQGEKR